MELLNASFLFLSHANRNVISTTVTCSTSISHRNTHLIKLFQQADMPSFQLNKLDLRDESPSEILLLKLRGAWKQGLPLPKWLKEQVEEDVDKYHKAKTEGRVFKPEIRIERDGNGDMTLMPRKKHDIVGDDTEGSWAKEPDNAMEPEDPTEKSEQDIAADGKGTTTMLSGRYINVVSDGPKEEREMTAGDEPVARPRAFFPTFPHPAPRPGCMQPANGSKIDGAVSPTDLTTEPELPWGLSHSVLQGVTGPLEIAPMFGFGRGNGKSQRGRLAHVRGKNDKKPRTTRQPTPQNPPRVYNGPVGNRDGFAEVRSKNNHKNWDVVRRRPNAQNPPNRVPQYEQGGQAPQFGWGGQAPQFGRGGQAPQFGQAGQFPQNGQAGQARPPQGFGLPPSPPASVWSPSESGYSGGSESSGSGYYDDSGYYSGYYTGSGYSSGSEYGPPPQAPTPPPAIMPGAYPAAGGGGGNMQFRGGGNGQMPQNGYRPQQGGWYR